MLEHHVDEARRPGLQTPLLNPFIELGPRPSPAPPFEFSLSINPCPKKSGPGGSETRQSHVRRAPSRELTQDPEKKRVPQNPNLFLRR
ncbi:MAG: hypothetical protein CL917_06885 [Deltaproteobacteria bacterium]|nr:hypothetical protein [Deltaproteobacteria bacterium]